MFGTIINVVTVILGGLLGILLKKGIKSEIMENVMKAEGVAVLIIGMNGVLTNMLSVGADGKISESGGLVLLISLALGAFVGELTKLDDRINSLGKLVEDKVKSSGFSKGFVSFPLMIVFDLETVLSTKPLSFERNIAKTVAPLTIGSSSVFSELPLPIVSFDWTELKLPSVLS